MPLLSPPPDLLEGRAYAALQGVDGKTIKKGPTTGLPSIGNGDGGRTSRRVIHRRKQRRGSGIGVWGGVTTPRTSMSLRNRQEHDRLVEEVKRAQENTRKTHNKRE